MANQIPTGQATGILTSGTQDTAYPLTEANLLQGFTDPDGDTLKVAAVLASSGDISELGDGLWRFTPDTNFSELVTFDYLVIDNHGGEAQGTLNLTLAANTVLSDVTLSGTDVITSEQGDTAVFAVSLTAAPKRDVSITFTSSDTSEGVITHPTLTFTAANWATAQTFTVTGQNDSVVDGDIAYTINASINTLDIIYKYVTVKNLTLTNQDTPKEIIQNLIGTDLSDQLQGSEAPSYILGKAGEDDLSGGAGNDTIYGSYGNDLLFGEADNDTLYGEQDADYLDGGTGNDILDGGLGLDTLIGGAGNDTYYLGYDAPDVINDKGLATDIDTIIMPYLLTSYTLPINIENGTIAAGTGASNLTGNDGNNTLTGNDGNNILNGEVGRDSLFGGVGDDQLEGGDDDDLVDAGDGNDEIIGGNGFGNDTYSGGNGEDTVTYTSAISSITVNLALGTAQGKEINNDQLNLIENTIGGQAGDVLIGDDIDNKIDGYTGNDTLNGGAGNDTLTGSLGNDIYIIDDAKDVVIESSTLVTEIDTVKSPVSYSLPDNVENLILTGTAAINGNGNPLANKLFGNTANNILNGGTGGDTLSGGLGNDTYIIDDPRDVVIENSTLATEIDRVESVINFTLKANIENLTLKGTVAINGAGNTLANTLKGNAGNNILDGGEGKDVLAGGAGSDKFRFTTTLTSDPDSITDFSIIDDTLQLENNIFTKLTRAGVLNKDNFIVAATAVDNDDYVVYNKTTGELFYDADGNGSGAAMPIATLEANLALTKADFFII